jgi:hypothetical protein
VQVVGVPVAIQGYADFDPVLGEQLTELFAEPDSIGVNAQIKATHRFKHAPNLGANPAKLVWSREQRLAAMQDDPNLVERVPASILGDALRCPGDGGLGDHFRPGSPALVCVFVDVAMVTG